MRQTLSQVFDIFREGEGLFVTFKFLSCRTAVAVLFLCLVTAAACQYNAKSKVEEVISARRDSALLIFDSWSLNFVNFLVALSGLY